MVLFTSVQKNPPKTRWFQMQKGPTSFVLYSCKHLYDYSYTVWILP